MVKAILRVGPVYSDPLGDDQHELCLDTTGDDTPRFFIDTPNEFVPLRLYLRDHPERRGEVLYVLHRRLG